MTEGGCQTFPQGCCGCCVNMRWRPERLRAFLAANTAAAARVFPDERPPSYRHLVRLHMLRGGAWDHLLLGLLAPLTLGLSVWLWARRFGSCRFAGYLDENGRVGCLVHPARVGGRRDLRRHAFPLILLVSCNRQLFCSMLSRADWTWDWHAASRAGFQSLRRPGSRRRRRHRENAHFSPQESLTGRIDKAHSKPGCSTGTRGAGK